MTRRNITLLALLLTTAQAHETVNAGNVKLEWHTDTNEYLQVNGDTTLTLTLKVKDRLLTLEDCRCTVLLYPGEVSPRVKPTLLKTVDSEEGTLETIITVEKAGSYSVVLDAKPRDVNLFSAFRTTLKLTAAHDVNNVQKGK